MSDRIPKEIRDGAGVPSMCGPKANPSRRGLLLSDVNVVTDNSVALKNALARITELDREVKAWELMNDLDIAAARVLVPRGLAVDVLAELSPQWHTETVRELLRVIEEQL